MYFYIQNIETRMVLDVKNNGKGEVITYPFHGGSNQLWSYDQVTEMIHSKQNGQVLDVVAKDSRVIVYAAHGGLNQRWTFDGDFTIRNRLGKVLDVKTKDNARTGTMIAYPKHGGPNQKFRRVYV